VRRQWQETQQALGATQTAREGRGTALGRRTSDSRPRPRSARARRGGGGLQTKIDALEKELAAARPAVAQGSQVAAELAQARAGLEKNGGRRPRRRSGRCRTHGKNENLVKDLEVAKQSAAAALAAQAAAVKAAPTDAMRWK